MALAIAKEGEEAEPREPAPPVLRPYLKFAKLRGPAGKAARQALDSDSSFRERVSARVDEDRIGRAGWLFVARPPGWDAELASLSAAAAERREAATEEREERGARRQAVIAQEAAQRAEAAAAQSRGEAVEAAHRLGEARKAQRDAEERAEALEAQLASASAARDVAMARITEQADRLRVLESGLKAAQDESAALKAQLDTRREGTPQPADAPLEAPAGPPAQEVPPAPVGWLGPLAEALAEASRASHHLATSLASAAEGLRSASTPAGAPSVSRPPLPSASSLVGSAGPAGPPPAAVASTGPSRATPAPRRVPVALPPAVFDDSPAAAQHLVKVPGTALVVDGYNASRSAWDGVPPAQQRRRLEDALAQLAFRTGVDVEVVWDGAEVDGPPRVPTTGRHPVRVTFSPPDVEADDVIISRVGEAPVNRPMLVASSDRRVQDGVRVQGANVISSDQLLDLLHVSH